MQMMTMKDRKNYGAYFVLFNCCEERQECNFWTIRAEEIKDANSKFPLNETNRKMQQFSRNYLGSTINGKVLKRIIDSSSL